MKILKTILAIYFIALLSVTWLPKIAIFDTLPNLILISALFLIFQKEYQKGFIWAFFGGLFLDFFEFGFPSNIFAATAIVLLAWFLLQKFFESSNIYLFSGFCFLASFVYGFLIFPAYHLELISYHLISAFYSVLYGLMLFLFWSQLKKKPQLRKEII